MREGCRTLRSSSCERSSSSDCKHSYNFHGSRSVTEQGSRSSSSDCKHKFYNLRKGTTLDK
eukprot:1142589-Pelagomonas_calceolata.AAC.5